MACIYIYICILRPFSILDDFIIPYFLCLVKHSSCPNSPIYAYDVTAFSGSSWTEFPLKWLVNRPCCTASYSECISWSIHRLVSVWFYSIGYTELLDVSILHDTSIGYIQLYDCYRFPLLDICRCVLMLVRDESDS